MAINVSSAETARQERARSGETGIGHSGAPGDNRPQGASNAPRAKMAPQPSPPPGVEQDNRGNAIPFEERTEEDQKLARSGPKLSDK